MRVRQWRSFGCAEQCGMDNLVMIVMMIRHMILVMIRKTLPAGNQRGLRCFDCTSIVGRNSLPAMKKPCESGSDGNSFSGR